MRATARCSARRASGPRSTARRPAREGLRRPLKREEDSRRLLNQADGLNPRNDRNRRRSDAFDCQEPARKARFVATLGPGRMAVGMVLAAVFTARFSARGNLARSATRPAVMGMAGVVVQRLNGSRREQITDDRTDD